MGVDVPVTVRTSTASLLARQEDVTEAWSPATPRIMGVGTAVAGECYSQQELLDIFRITDPKVRSVFFGSAIGRRYLTLPDVDAHGLRMNEGQGELLGKHTRVATAMGGQALTECLKDAGADMGDIKHLCCVTSTGFLTPGLSALLIRQLGISPACSRADIVGMGCNGGLNALNVVAGWAVAHPRQLAVMLCAEACSAAYVFDGTMRTAIVNSLFGDGGAAIALIADGPGGGASGGEASADGPDGRPDAAAGGTGAGAGARILSVASRIITDAFDAMRYDWDREQGKFSFFLDPEIPYVVGAHVTAVIDQLVSAAGLRRSDIRHWLVHSGGKKVIDAVVINLGLTDYDLRHTIGVLRDYGNLSSGSFLFSYQRLLRDGVTSLGDYGVMMTMGPGSTIEAALIQW
ncbi:MAG: 3,5-dihydroxyphenylacetyl-CoA synthase DpgA [Streptosporangiaceae bacterium]